MLLLQGSFAEEIKGFFSSLFGSPAPVKRSLVAPPKVASMPSSSHSAAPIVKKNPKYVMMLCLYSDFHTLVWIYGSTREQ